MIPVIYGCIFIASIICSAIYIYIWHKHYDVNFALIFTLVPVACAGYFLSSIATNMGEAITASKIIFFGGCFLHLFILLSIYNLCQIEIMNWLRVLLFGICALIYASVLTIGYTDMFYKNISFSMMGNTPIFERDYGFMHIVFYVVVVIFFASGLIATIYSFLKKRQVPRTILSLLVLPDIICMICFFVGRVIIGHFELMPIGYVIAQIIYIIIASRVNLHDVGTAAIDSMVRDAAIGYISFDFRYRYLGSNETARYILPDLSDLAVDDMLGSRPFEKKIRHVLDSFSDDPASGQFVYTFHGKSDDPEDDRIYNVNVSYLYGGSRKRGYVITFTDDTANKKYLSLLDTYNSKLEQEVERKTRSVIEMHDNLILSLAMMIESRDDSTGGHIKRTSDVVRILIDELIKSGAPLSEEFCHNVIKAAPMHDLGKIAVDDAVLRKPGIFTDEEYKKMMLHTSEGARIIHEILKNTDDESFKTIAENVAHYHHEHWDGSGYPEGLAGTQIPIEARIMAVADVYDALVSKRPYKEALDFEKVNSLILERMGTQFDPALKDVYEKARPRLEEYYKNASLSS